MKILHFLITRFNLPVYRPNKNGIQQNHLGQWLYERCKLFEKYCLPSVLGQTNKNYKWLLIFDNETPNDVFNRYRSDSIIPVKYNKTVDEDEASVCQKVVKKQLVQSAHFDMLLTTRLDNDDMIYNHFVAEIQNGVAKSFREEPLLYQYPVGCDFDIRTNKWKRCIDNGSNSFISLAESFSEQPQTAMTHKHRAMKNHFKMINVNKQIAWARIIHENNLANEMWPQRFVLARNGEKLKKRGFIFNP